MNTVEDKILALVKMANPQDPVKYVQQIVKNFAIEKINNGIKTCSCCDLNQYGIKTITYGDVNSSILMISDDVSEEQYRNGNQVTLPLLDNDGKTLDRALGVINANKSAIYMMNSVNCYPAKTINGKTSKRIPSVKERTTCKKHIDNVIAALDPAVIITLGSVSSNALSSSKISIMESRGKEFDYKGYSVIPTFHPGFFRQMADKFDEEILNMYKDNFLTDLYNAFNIALSKNQNCGIGDICLPF